MFQKIKWALLVLECNVVDNCVDRHAMPADEFRMMRFCYPEHKHLIL